MKQKGLGQFLLDLFYFFKCILEQMVKLLLNKGANLSAIDKKERQPIHCAAYLGKRKVANIHQYYKPDVFIFVSRSKHFNI